MEVGAVLAVATNGRRPAPPQPEGWQTSWGWPAVVATGGRRPPPPLALLEVAVEVGVAVDGGAPHSDLGSDNVSNSKWRPLPLLLVGLLVRRPRLVKTVTHGMLHGGEHAKEQSQVATLQPVTRFHSCPQSVAMMRIHVHELRTPVSEHPT